MFLRLVFNMYFNLKCDIYTYVTILCFKYIHTYIYICIYTSQFKIKIYKYQTDIDKNLSSLNLTTNQLLTIILYNLLFSNLWF